MEFSSVEGYLETIKNGLSIVHADRRCHSKLDLSIIILNLLLFGSQMMIYNSYYWDSVKDAFIEIIK